MKVINRRTIVMGWNLLDHNYSGKVDLGTTEYTLIRYDGKKYVLIPGSNEGKDWLKNVNFTSTEGIKKVGVEAAEEILRELFASAEDLYEPIYFIVHSKSGPTGVKIAKYAEENNLPWIVIAFNPARSVRRSAKIKLKNMIIFRNRFDAVSELGFFINFSHPKCLTFFNWSLRHKLKHWGKYLNTKLQKMISIH